MYICSYLFIYHFNVSCFSFMLTLPVCFQSLVLFLSHSLKGLVHFLTFASGVFFFIWYETELSLTWYEQKILKNRGIGGEGAVHQSHWRWKIWWSDAVVLTVLKEYWEYDLLCLGMRCGSPGDKTNLAFNTALWHLAMSRQHFRAVLEAAKLELKCRS